jgi:hypothetical protein
VRAGDLSSLALGLSGLAIAAMPERTASQLGLVVGSQRGVAEVRAGLGGTFAALGLWAFLRGSGETYSAVGVTWLGAAAVRTVALRTDDPEPDASYWAYLAAETTLGLAGLLAGSRRRP